jgi:hypothetical protein
MIIPPLIVVIISNLVLYVEWYADIKISKLLKFLHVWVALYSHKPRAVVSLTFDSEIKFCYESDLISIKS